MTVKAFLKGEEKKRIAKQEAAAKAEEVKAEAEINGQADATADVVPHLNGPQSSEVEKDVKLKPETQDEDDDGSASPASSECSVEVGDDQPFRAVWPTDHSVSSF